jgi:maltokinase
MTRPITVDQTHESVVVGERLVVKWYRSAAPARALTLIAHLAEVGFAGTPACYAALLRGDAPAVLVTENLPGARDGWQWCVEAFGEDFGAALGELAARLHAALATASSVLPNPVQPASTQDTVGWAAQGDAALAEALALTDGPDGEWLASVAPLLRRDLIPLSHTETTPLLRVHGDLHVGQILRWTGGYRVIDFDGNPTAAERAEHQPAARDLAQLLTSLEHVAMIVAKTSPREAALARAQELRADLLAGYRSTLSALGHSALLGTDKGLLRAFEVEQECRELIYAAKFLPRWRYAPIGVLRSWYA